MAVGGIAAVRAAEVVVVCGSDVGVDIGDQGWSVTAVVPEQVRPGGK